MSIAKISEMQDTDTLRSVFEDLPEIIEVYHDNELQMLFGMLQELSGEHQGFDAAFGAARDEIMFRKS